MGNPPWQTELHAARTARDEHEASDAFVDALFADERHFPHGHNTSSWELHLRENTPAAFYSDPASLPEAGPPRCLELESVVVGESALHAPGGLSAETRAAAKAALTDCGYVVLDNMYRRRQVDELRDAYEALKAGPDGPLFRYPVQGAGRVEHLLPFRPPFNESAALYADPRLLTILYDFLGEHVKLELMTVINSPPGSGDQRWHQGWRYLFHPEERLPPYAVVVTLPLTDVSIEMGPTEICPGKKLRLLPRLALQPVHGQDGDDAGDDVDLRLQDAPPRPRQRGVRRPADGVDGVLEGLLPERRGRRQPRHPARADAPPAAVLGAVLLAPGDGRRTVPGLG